MEEKYIVKTSVGKFRVDKTKTHLRIGGKKFCVEIKLADQELQWLITKEGGCELDNIEIQGSKTLHMLNLSFTLLRTYTNTNNIKLLDNSTFDCELADGTKSVIFMNKYSYLFYGGTWYDVKTNAVPIDSSQGALYEETKPLYNDPSIKKPFDFNNPGLQKELTPLYERTNTWKEFADLLHKTYDKENLCRKILPWYMNAVAILTKNRMLPEYWIIDLSKTEVIPYERIAIGGGTRKKVKYIMPYYNLLSPSELFSKVL